MIQLSEDTYIRRFKEQLQKRSVDVSELNEMQIRTEALKHMGNGVPPSVAVTKCFTSLHNKRGNAEKAIPAVLMCACKEMGIEFETHIDGKTKAHMDMRSMVCWITVIRLNLRPHTVIKDALGLKSNSYVNHAVYRAASKITGSVVFAEKLDKILVELKLESLTANSVG